MYTRGLNLLEEKICFLLNLVGKVSLKIDDKKRERLLQFSLMLIGICAYGYSALPINVDRKSTRLNSSHSRASRMPSSA